MTTTRIENPFRNVPLPAGVDIVDAEDWVDLDVNPFRYFMGRRPVYSATTRQTSRFS
jgi:hypothetical protein